MHLLYYWRYHKQDWANYEGRPSYRLIQNSPAMLQANTRDSLWAFCRRSDGRYVPAAQLVVAHVEELRSPDISKLIRSLDIRVNSEVLGYSFQGRNGVRTLGEGDHARLVAFCKNLPTV